MIHLFITVAAFCLLLASLPLVAELCVLSCAAVLPSRLPKASNPFAPVRLAVIIPAHNEQQLVAACIGSLQHSHHPPDAIYVVAHNCADDTATNAEAAGADVLVLHDDGARGKGAALHHGFTHALGRGCSALLVIDADSVVEPTLTERVADAIGGGADAVQARYVASNADSDTRTTLLALSLTGMNVVRPRGRAGLGLSCGIFGNGFALSAATLQSVPYTAHSVVEDLEYHLSLVQSGQTVRFLDEATVLGELPDNNRAAGTQRARWEGGRAHIRKQFVPRLSRSILRGNLRLLEPLLDLLSLPVATVVPILLTMAALPLHWSRIYACAGLLSLVLYVAVSVALSPSPSASCRALASVPGYLLFKVGLVRAKRNASHRNAAWVRTARNTQPTPSPTHRERLP